MCTSVHYGLVQLLIWFITNFKLKYYSMKHILRAVDSCQHNKKSNLHVFLLNMFHIILKNLDTYSAKLFHFTKIPFLLHHISFSCCCNKDKTQSGCFCVSWLWTAFILFCAPGNHYCVCIWCQIRSVVINGKRIQSTHQLLSSD